MGSEGGNARKSKLTPERRKEIAAAASKARWEKKKPAAAPVEVAPALPVPVAKKLKTPPMRPEFRKAYSSAEKRLSVALKERGDCLLKMAALNAEIPYLVGVIKSLGGTVPPNVAVGGEMMQFQTPQLLPVDPPPHLDPASPMFRAPALPSGPRAQGGAFGVIGDPNAVDENAFLTDPNNPASGGGFR